MLLSKGLKVLWRKMFKSCSYAAAYRWIKGKWSQQEWKEIGQDKDRGEYHICESADKRRSETTGIKDEECDGTRNDTTGNDVIGNDVPGNCGAGSDISASNVSVSLTIESHVSASYDVSGGKNVVESDVGGNESIQSHVSGNNMAGSNMIEGSDDVSSSKSNVERHLSLTSEAAKSVVSRDDVTRSSDGGRDVDGESVGSVNSVADTIRPEVSEPLNQD